MNSMTGFGKCELEVDGRKLRVEMKSVNNRFLDMNIRQPRFMMQYEDAVRQFVKSHLSRGRVDIFINYSCIREDAKGLTVDLGLAAAYVNAARQIAEATGVADDLSVSHILRLPDVVSCEEDEDEQAVKALLLRCLEGAVAELKNARAREGAQLKADILERLDMLAGFAQSISLKEDTVVSEYRQKLTERLAELLGGAAIDEQRLAQEVAIYADRANITEEIVRIKSHVKQFKNLAVQAGAQGRNMDFIVQELNREFNTIGSKSQDADIMKTVIAAKGEIEKIREQIQNIE